METTKKAQSATKKAKSSLDVVYTPLRVFNAKSGKIFNVYVCSKVYDKEMVKEIKNLYGISFFINSRVCFIPKMSTLLNIIKSKFNIIEQESDPAIYDFNEILEKFKIDRKKEVKTEKKEKIKICKDLPNL